MSVSLKDIHRVKSVLPPRTLLYGPQKVGKTTLANEWPNTVFIQTEQGENANDEISTWGLMTSYEDVIGAIGALYSEDHGYQNVVVDTLDKFEPLVWEATCAANNWSHIEDPGYGRGYLAADVFWRDFLGGLNALRRDKGMSVTLLAHSEIKTFNDPRSVSYSRYDIRLEKRALAGICDEMDLIAFLNIDPGIQEEKKGFHKDNKRAVAAGGSTRWIYVENLPSINCGNRYGMPSKFPYVKGKGYAMLAKFLPSVNGGVQPAPESEAAEQAAA